MANIEQLIFDNISKVRDVKPGSTDPDDSKAARLNAAESDRMVGTSLMLKVMPGDRFAISADAYYEDDAPSQGTVAADAVVSSLTDALLGGQTYEGIPLKELPDNARIVETALGAGSVATQISDLAAQTDEGALPKAHLNVLFFDDKFQLRPEYSHIIQVPQGTLHNWSTLQVPGMPTEIYPIPGYTLIYVDNQEIGKDVWFDNILIQHYNSEVISEQHYYPFGLTLDIDNDATVTTNPYKYNTKELERHFGLESYEYGARMMDPQLGMWHVADPMAEQSRRWSPYTYALNNPVRFIDPDGMIWKDPEEAEALKNDIVKTQVGLTKDKEALQAKLDNKDNPLSEKKAKKIQGKVDDLTARIGRLEESVTSIDALGADQNHTYDLVSNDGGDKNYVQKGNDGVINIEGATNALHVHEIKHVANSLASSKGLLFNKSGYLKPIDPTGEKDEIDAYKTQYSYLPSSLPQFKGTIKSINLRYIANLRDEDRQPVYKALNAKWERLSKEEKKEYE